MPLPLLLTRRQRASSRVAHQSAPRAAECLPHSECVLACASCGMHRGCTAGAAWLYGSKGLASFLKRQVHMCSRDEPMCMHFRSLLMKKHPQARLVHGLTG